MKKHDGHIRGFRFCDRAYYAKALPQAAKNEISFGLYAIGGGTSGEMIMKWRELGGKNTPQLRVFDDAWHALSTFSDVITKLADVDDESITQDQFGALLLSCGFKDMTEYVRGD